MTTQEDREAAAEIWERAALADLYHDPRNTGPEFGPEPHDPVGVIAQALTAHRIAAEQRIVAWLREAAYDPTYLTIAQAIEAGEHLAN